MKSSIIITFFAILSANLCAQKQTDKMPINLPYYSIPDTLTTFTSGNIIARFIDGLGYRYYWATEGLTEKDLLYKPSLEGQSTRQTLEHIYDLSNVIINALEHKLNKRSDASHEFTFKELRESTLINLSNASSAFSKLHEDDLNNVTIIFQDSEGSTNEFPLWNVINGPLSDALYHTGQIVSFRRSSGNPINPNVNVLRGKTSE